MIFKRSAAFNHIPDPVIGCTVDYATNYNSAATLDNGSCTYLNQSEQALIAEASEELVISHGEFIKNEYLIGYPASSVIIRGKNLSDGFQYATNTHLGALIYSYGGLTGNISNAFNVYPTTQMFMPLGSNSPIELSQPSTIPVIITVGAGTTENETGYGNGLEFWDEEVQGSPALQASLSNGRIAGKIMNIRNALNCTFWEARARARYTADRTLLTHPNGKKWNKFNGFGKINVTAAINLNAAFFCEDPDECIQIPADPWLNAGNVYWPYIP